MTKIDIICGENLATTIEDQHLDGQKHVLPCKAYSNNTPCEFIVRGHSSDNYNAERTGNGCPVLNAITHRRRHF